MKLKILAAAAATAIAFLVCGCGDFAGDGASAHGLATGPRAPSGSLMTIGFEKAPFDKLAKKSLGDKHDEIAESVKEKMPNEIKEALEKSGLKDSDIVWAALTVTDVEFDENGNIKDGYVPPIIVAIGIEHDFDKLSDSLKATARQEMQSKFRDAEALGEKALYFTSKGTTAGFASIHGKIIVIGTSPALLEQGVALYRNGIGGTNLAMGGDTYLRLDASGIGERVFKKIPAETLKSVLDDEILPNAPAILRGLKTLSATLSASGESAVAVNIASETANISDAAALADAANQAVAQAKPAMALAAQLDQSAKPLADSLNSFEAKTNGTKFTFSGKILSEAIKNMK